MSDIADRLAEIRERVEAATEGPEQEAFREGYRYGYDCGMGCATYTGYCGAPDVEESWEESDARSSARSDVPYLLSLVEDQREQIEQLGRRLKDAHEAIKRMPKEALGRDPKEGYYYRDELLHRIESALRDAALQAEEESDGPRPE